MATRRIGGHCAGRGADQQLLAIGSKSARKCTELLLTRMACSSRYAASADRLVILVNKSSVHFRADFEPIAEKLLICAAPGAMPADPPRCHGRDCGRASASSRTAPFQSRNLRHMDNRTDNMP